MQKSNLGKIDASSAPLTSDQRLRAVIEQSVAGVAELELNGRHQFVNDRLCEITGYSAEELCGMRFSDLMVPSDGDLDRAVWETALRLGKAEISEMRFRRKGGDLGWGSISAVVIRDSANVPRSFAVMVLDITDRKQAELELERTVAIRTAELKVEQTRIAQAAERLAATESRYRTIFEQAPLGMVIVDSLTGRVCEVNLRFAEMVGRTREELVGVDWTTVMHSDEIAPDRESMTRLIGTEAGGIRMDYRCVRPNGSSFLISATIAPLQSTCGEGGRHLYMIEEIAERNTADEAFRTNEDQFRARVENISECIWELDALGRFTYLSPRFQELTGYSPEEYLGKTPAGLLAEDREHIFRDWLQAGMPDPRIQVRGRRKDGQEYDAEIRGSKHFSATGEYLGVRGITLDITERKRAEEELVRSRKASRALTARREEQREQERLHLAREIHDTFGHALTDWKMDLVWLGQQLADAGISGRTAVGRKIAAMSRRAETEMESVRRIAGELRPALLDTVGLVPAMEWLAADFQMRTRICCRLKLPQVPPLEPARATALYRILQELLANVARHARARRVEIRLRAAEDCLELQVCDDGCGISVRDANDPAALGLLGIRERVAGLGGEVLIRGVRGKGTTATVRLPMAKRKEGV